MASGSAFNPGTWKKAAAGVAVAVGVATAAAGAGWWNPGGTFGPPSANGVSANIWVNTSAGASPSRSSSAAAYDSTHAYGSLNAAYQAASCGDVIGVHTGTYDTQEIDTNGSSCSSNVTFVPDGVVTLRSLTPNNSGVLRFGGTCKCSTNKPPDHIVFDGGTSKNFHFGVAGVDGSGGYMGQIVFYPDYNTDTYPSNITLTNLVVENATPDSGNGAIAITGYNITVSHSTIGPICCGQLNGVDFASPAEILIANRAGQPVSNYVTISDNVLLGETHVGSTLWPAALGTPPQSDCGNTTCHTDAIHVEGGNNLSFYRNKIYNSQTQAMFFEEIQGPVTNVTIVGNYINSLAGCGICMSPDTNNLSGGAWLIAFNTSNAGMGVARNDATYWAPGTTITFVGNYGGLSMNNTATTNLFCSWTAPNVTVTYSYNVWTNTTGCSASDKAASSTFAVAHLADWNSGDNGIDYATAAGSAALSFVPAATCTAYTTVDLNGISRPNAAHPTVCDAGADETR